MYEDFLKQEAKIIRKVADFSGGLAGTAEEVIATESCSLSSPNQRDFQQIQHQQINKQIWKIHLNKNSKIQEWDLLEVEGIRYSPIYIYPVRGRGWVHHIKILAFSI